MKRWLPGLALALAALSGGACRDHTGDGYPFTPDAGSATTLALTALDEELVGSHCDYLLRCGYYADRAVCERSLTFNLAEALGPHITAGRVVYDATAAAACIAGIRAGSCYFYDPAPPSPTICRKVFQGTAGADEPCAIDSQCRSGVCDPSSPCGAYQCCPGTCLSFPESKVVGLGEACTSESENLTCGDGTVCKLTLDGQYRFTCVTRVGLGESCDELPCQRELFCMPSTTGPATCVHYPRRGEACSDALGICAFRNDYCDKSTFKCVALQSDGAPCESDSTCARTSYCDVATTQTCQPKSPPGGACLSNRQCMAFVDCIGGKCTTEPRTPVCPVL
jgi:hypothetical protein